MKSSTERYANRAVLAALVLLACERKEAHQVAPQSSTSSASAVHLGVSDAPAPSAVGSGGQQDHTSGDTAPNARAEQAPCPEGMQRIAGGAFEAGASDGARDERPRFVTKLADYCLDTTEVTVDAYQQCVASGACTAALGKQITCNAGHEDRGHHPINCVDWGQADRYCQQRGARLPSELEWEYAARGGSEARKYSWGNEPPEGQLCWKRGRSCEVASFPSGAFGLYDMIGNVWEWTSSWYAPYPWPAEHGQLKVYRGGSWSRRFEKWLRPTLRNRFQPDHWGSHLGFRCAKRAAGASCPFGEDSSGECLPGVQSQTCPTGESFNGVRCAPPGAPTCEPESQLVPGHGCVGTGGGGLVTAATVGEDDVTAVKWIPSPAFDEDCRAFQPGRPKAYRLEGGTHPSRNVAGKRRGCKNRDVGVGWNSTCCPQ